LSHVLGDDLPKVTRITGIATEGLHQHGNPRLVFHNQVEHHVVEVGPMIAAVASRDMNDLFIRLLAPVVAPIDMEAGAIEMGQGRCQPEALSGRDRNETVEVCHASRIERVQGASQRIIMERAGFDSGGDEALCGFVLKEHRHKIELLVHKAQPIEDHRFDSMAYCGMSVVLLDDIHAIEPFPRGQDFASSCRLVTCTKEAAGKRLGTSGQNIGHAHRTWACSDAAVLCWRNNPTGQTYLVRLENKPDTGKALTILAPKLARAVYDLRKRQTAGDRDMFRRASGRSAGEPEVSLDTQGNEPESCVITVLFGGVFERQGEDLGLLSLSLTG
jgi:hypothetical protein